MKIIVKKLPDKINSSRWFISEPPFWKEDAAILLIPVVWREKSRYHPTFGREKSQTMGLLRQKGLLWYLWSTFRGRHSISRTIKVLLMAAFCGTLLANLIFLSHSGQILGKESGNGGGISSHPDARQPRNLRQQVRNWDSFQASFNTLGDVLDWGHFLKQSIIFFCTCFWLLSVFWCVGISNTIFAFSMLGKAVRYRSCKFETGQYSHYCTLHCNAKTTPLLTK